MGWLNCTVSKGQFTGEYAVRGELFNSKSFSMFVPDACVKVKEVPAGDKHVQGFMQVHILDKKDDLVLVLLPQPAFENGRTITVKKDQMQTE